MNSATIRRVCSMLAWFVLAALTLAGTSLFADQDDPPGRAARLSVVQGNVSFQPSGEDQWSQATLNYTLTTGDRLYTDQGARAELEVGPFAVRMSESTDLTIANLNDRTMQLGLGQGSVRVSVYEMPPGNTVEIDSPNGALLALGRGTYRVDVDPNYGTRLSVFNGSMEITGAGTDQRVDRGQAVELTGTGPIQITPVDFPGRDGFDQWSDSRDARVRAFASRRYVSAYTPGAEDLDSYGRWETVSDYGPVWYPAGVPGGWVPYRYGHWAWIEPWGWTWVEDEPWGFCPFHYGRWAFIGTAWGWVPGPVVVAPVYAPAFVAFVGGSGFSIGVQVGGLGVAAWFPLGPREPFIPWYHYSGGYLRQINVTNVRNVTNITNITNITNVNNIHYENRTVATTAVPAETFRSGQPVARQVIHVAPQQLAQAQVVAHPSVTPVKTAAFGGHPPAPTPPVSTPPVRASRTTAPFQGSRGGQPPVRSTPPGRGTSPTAAAPGARPSSTPPPVITRSSPPARTEPSQPAPSFNRGTPPPRTQPGQPASSGGGFRPFGGNRPVTPPPSTPPPVITRTPPPPRDVPFSAHEPAYQQHPGRPLEPQQEQNLRVGRPPGPMRDREVAPHAPPPAPRAAPSRTPTKTESRPEPPKQKERR